MGKFTGYTELAATPAADDQLIIDDTSATETKRIQYSNLIGTSLLITMFQGCLQRPKFEYSSTTAILIGAGWYEHNGTAQQMLYWHSQLTYTFGSGGSNANSEDLGASEWHYLYIDDSELAGATMVAGEFVNNTTAPSWSETKHGWYNGNDRCIGAFLTNASSQIIEFWHDGGEDFKYSADITDRALVSLTASWTAQTLTAPDFGDGCQVICGFTCRVSNGGGAFQYRKTGSSAAGSRIAYVTDTASAYDVADDHHNTEKVTVNASQQIDIYGNSGGTLAVLSKGYCFPRGM